MIPWCGVALSVLLWWMLREERDSAIRRPARCVLALVGLAWLVAWWGMVVN